MTGEEQPECCCCLILFSVLSEVFDHAEPLAEPAAKIARWRQAVLEADNL
jgi:hypothetical protein